MSFNWLSVNHELQIKILKNTHLLTKTKIYDLYDKYQTWTDAVQVRQFDFWFDRNYSPQINLDETDFEKNGNSGFFSSKTSFFQVFLKKSVFEKI